MRLLWSFLLFLIGHTECARIFGYFPTPSISHQIVFHALVKDLAERGHHLTILTPNLIKTDNPNITQIDLSGSYKTEWADLNQVELKITKKSKKEMFTAILDTHTKVVDWQLSQPEVKKLIENADGKKFDVVLLELLWHSVALGFAEIFDAPVIDISSMEPLTLTHRLFGNEMNPVVHPDNIVPFSHGKLTFIQRMKTILFYLNAICYYEPMVLEWNGKLLQKHFPTVTASFDEMKKRNQLLFSNTSPALGFIRPLVPTTIQLGFMHIQPPKPLPEGELKSFLDNSKNGVIYMSLGSNAKSKDLNDKFIQLFLKVFSKLNLNVLWKFEDESLPGKPDNVMISKWLPQADMLAHPNVKLFITHGGHQSMEESIDRTVPMIVIPFIVDQNVNALRMKEKEIGLHFDIMTLTESQLLEAIDEMLKPKYKKNIETLRRQVYDQPMTSRERAVWWTEFVIRNKGTKHLAYPGTAVPFYQKFWLEFTAIVLSLVLTALTILGVLVKVLIGKVSKKPKKD